MIFTLWNFYWQNSPWTKSVSQTVCGNLWFWHFVWLLEEMLCVFLTELNMFCVNNFSECWTYKQILLSSTESYSAKCWNLRKNCIHKLHAISHIDFDSQCELLYIIFLFLLLCLFFLLILHATFCFIFSSCVCILEFTVNFLSIVVLFNYYGIDS